MSVKLELHPEREMGVGRRGRRYKSDSAVWSGRRLTSFYLGIQVAEYPDTQGSHGQIVANLMPLIVSVETVFDDRNFRSAEICIFGPGTPYLRIDRS